MAATGTQCVVMRLTSGMVRNQRDCGPQDACMPVVVQGGRFADRMVSLR